MIIRNRQDAAPFVTLDGSIIREIVHPNSIPSATQSLAEARLEPKTATSAHIHNRTEEIYYILSGTGRMHIGIEAAEVEEYDAVLIPPGSEHYIENTGDTELVFLCCSTPAYSDEDTVIQKEKIKSSSCINLK